MWEEFNLWLASFKDGKDHELRMPVSSLLKLEKA